MAVSGYGLGVVVLMRVPCLWNGYLERILAQCRTPRLVQNRNNTGDPLDKRSPVDGA